MYANWGTATTRTTSWRRRDTTCKDSEGTCSHPLAFPHCSPRGSLPASRKVIRQVSFGRYNLRRDPLKTYSTTASERPARCKNGRNCLAFCVSWEERRDTIKEGAPAEPDSCSQRSAAVVPPPATAPLPSTSQRTRVSGADRSPVWQTLQDPSRPPHSCTVLEQVCTANPLRVQQPPTLSWTADLYSMSWSPMGGRIINKNVTSCQGESREPSHAGQQGSSNAQPQLISRRDGGLCRICSSSQHSEKVQQAQ